MARKTAVHPLLKQERPKFATLSHAAYHADKTAVGRSGLWTFRERRRAFEAEYLERIELGNGKASKEADIGTLAHAGLLEPEDFRSRYAIYPAKMLDSRGAVSTAAAKAWRAEQEAKGLVVIKEKDLPMIERMVDSVVDTLGGRGWLDVPAHREQVIFWNHPATGIRCKAKIDWLIITQAAAFVIDFKTSDNADPSSWRYRCEDSGVWLQDSHYGEGAGLVTGLPVEFLYVVVERQWPHATSVQRLRPRDRQAAAEARESYLASLKQCLVTGDFAEPWESKVSEISLRPSCFQPIG